MLLTATKCMPPLFPFQVCTCLRISSIWLHFIWIHVRSSPFNRNSTHASISTHCWYMHMVLAQVQTWLEMYSFWVHMCMWSWLIPIRYRFYTYIAAYSVIYPWEYVLLIAGCSLPYLWSHMYIHPYLYIHFLVYFSAIYVRAYVYMY